MSTDQLYSREAVLEDDAGSGCGDCAVGTAYEARYIRHLDDGDFAVVTVVYYVEDERLRNPDRERDEFHFDLVQRIEWMRCRDAEDPGGTEVWCDYDYDYPHAFGFADLAEAERQCRRMAIDDFRRYFTWDGEPNAV